MMATISTSVQTISPTLVLGWDSARSARTVLHDVLERSDPEVTVRPAATRSGTLTYLFDSLTDALACEELHATSSERITLSEAPATPMSYVVSGDVGLSAATEAGTAWSVAVTFREVPA